MQLFKEWTWFERIWLMVFTVYWSSCAGHFYLRIFILQWAHPIVGCMRPFKIVIMNELRDFLFNNVFIHGRSVT